MSFHIEPHIIPCYIVPHIMSYNHTPAIVQYHNTDILYHTITIYNQILPYPLLGHVMLQLLGHTITDLTIYLANQTVRVHPTMYCTIQCHTIYNQTQPYIYHICCPVLYFLIGRKSCWIICNMWLLLRIINRLLEFAIAEYSVNCNWG